MGAFDKFRSSDKLFWDSSRRKIDKIPNTYINAKSQYTKALGRYYAEYTIDIFDKENIDKLFEFYPLVKIGITKNSQVYDDLKEIQRNSEDYVIDYLSYKNCLKAYYGIHGKDTEWLLKLFVERYDLDRFNIEVEDVLDDLHEIMDTVAELPSLKKNSNNSRVNSKLEENDTVPIQLQKELLGAIVSDTPIYNNLDLSGMGDFHAYVTSYGHNQLISAIKTQYLTFKNTCKYAPALGTNGCLEFAGGLLLSVYMIEKVNKAKTDSSYSKQQIKTLCDELISLMIIIFSAFLGSTPTEWSNMADKFAENSSFLTKREWSIIYLYLRDNHADDIRKMEFNAGNSYSHLADRKKTADVLATAKGDLGMLKRYFVSEGLLVVW